MLDHEHTPRRRRGQRHDQGPDHRVGLLGVLVRGEELARCVDQHRVELGCQLASLRQTEIGAQAIEDGSEGSVPLLFVDLNAALRDLPRVADLRVQQRLLALAEPGRSTYQAQLLRLADRDGQSDQADAVDLQPQVIGAGGASRAERAYSRGPTQKTRKPVTRKCCVRRHGKTVVALGTPSGSRVPAGRLLPGAVIRPRRPHSRGVMTEPADAPPRLLHPVPEQGKRGSYSAKFGPPFRAIGNRPVRVASGAP
jgi:hypothetical protein